MNRELELLAKRVKQLEQDNNHLTSEVNSFSIEVERLREENGKDDIRKAWMAGYNKGHEHAQLSVHDQKSVCVDEYLESIKK